MQFVFCFFTRAEFTSRICNCSLKMLQCKNKSRKTSHKHYSDISGAINTHFHPLIRSLFFLLLFINYLFSRDINESNLCCIKKQQGLYQSTNLKLHPHHCGIGTVHFTSYQTPAVSLSVTMITTYFRMNEVPSCFITDASSFCFPFLQAIAEEYNELKDLKQVWRHIPHHTHCRARRHESIDIQINCT